MQNDIEEINEIEQLPIDTTPNSIPTPSSRSPKLTEINSLIRKLILAVSALGVINSSTANADEVINPGGQTKVSCTTCDKDCSKERRAVRYQRSKANTAQKALEGVNDRLEREIEKQKALQQEIDGLKASLQQAEGKLRDEKARIGRYQSQNEQVCALQQQVSTLQQRISSLEGLNGELKENIAILSKELRELISLLSAKPEGASSSRDVALPLCKKDRDSFIIGLEFYGDFAGVSPLSCDCKTKIPMGGRLLLKNEWMLDKEEEYVGLTLGGFGQMGTSSTGNLIGGLGAELGMNFYLPKPIQFFRIPLEARGMWEYGDNIHQGNVSLGGGLGLNFRNFAIDYIARYKRLSLPNSDHVFESGIRLEVRPPIKKR